MTHYDYTAIYDSKVLLLVFVGCIFEFNWRIVSEKLCDDEKMSSNTVHL